jgi:hypothetical protein
LILNTRCPTHEFGSFLMHIDMRIDEWTFRFTTPKLIEIWEYCGQMLKTKAILLQLIHYEIAYWYE